MPLFSMYHHMCVGLTWYVPTDLSKQAIKNSIGRMTAVMAMTENCTTHQNWTSQKKLQSVVESVQLQMGGFFFLPGPEGHDDTPWS